MTEIDALKICRYIETAMNTNKTEELKCTFIYHPSHFIGHVILNANLDAEKTIEEYFKLGKYKSKSKDKSAVAYFNISREVLSHYFSATNSRIVDLFTMPIEKLLLLADLNDVE